MILRDAWAGPGRTVIRRFDFASQPEQVAFLKCMIEVYRGTQTIRNKAVDIVFREYRCPQKQQAAHALAIADWVKKNVIYVNEGTETFQSPIKTLKLGYGDCDDYSSLIGSLCEAIGIPIQLVALGWRGGYRHIFPRAVVRLGGKTVALPLDATLSEPIGTNPIRKAIRDHGADVHTLTV